MIVALILHWNIEFPEPDLLSWLLLWHVYDLEEDLFAAKVPAERDLLIFKKTEKCGQWLHVLYLIWVWVYLLFLFQ